MKKTPLAMMLMATLSGCGGGGSDGGNTDSPTPPSASLAMSGKAIDGYIQGATVYLDLNFNFNFNRQWNEGEPKTTTNDAGDYRLELPIDLQTCAQYAPLVVDVPVDAVDQDLGPGQNPIRWSFLPPLPPSPKMMPIM